MLDLVLPWSDLLDSRHFTWFRPRRQRLNLKHKHKDPDSVKRNWIHCILSWGQCWHQPRWAENPPKSTTKWKVPHTKKKKRNMPLLGTRLAVQQKLTFTSKRLWGTKMASLSCSVSLCRGPWELCFLYSLLVAGWRPCVLSCRLADFLAFCLAGWLPWFLSCLFAGWLAF